MQIMRLVVGIVLVAVASDGRALATDQSVESSPQANARELESRDNRVPGAVAQAKFDGPWPGEEAPSKLRDDNLGWNDSILAPAPDPKAEPSILGLEDSEFLGCCTPACVDPCPCFYGQVEALFFMRNPRFAGQAIVVDPNTNTTFLSTSNLASNFNPGLRATFGMRLCSGRALEFDYFGLFAGNTSAVAVQPDPSAFLIFPDNFFGNVFVDMSRVEMNYSSGLQSFAINFPCCCGCCEPCVDECGCSENRCRSFEWYGGFRYLNLSETLNIAAQRVVGGAIEEGNYNIRTANNLYGAQLGARVRRTSGRYGYELGGWGGIFGNDARQTQQVTDFPDFPLRPSISSSRGSVAFVGGGNASALYLLNDVWNLRLGYNLIWIEGLALAPEQLDFDFASAGGGNQVDSGGGLLLHGINVGVEARW